MALPLIETMEEALAFEAACLLDGKGRLAECAVCGEHYRGGYGHPGSDYCLVISTEKVQSRLGYMQVSRRYKMILQEAGISTHETYGGFIMKPGTYKNACADTRMYAERWVHRMISFTSRYCFSRSSRVLLLRALAEDGANNLRTKLSDYMSGEYSFSGNQAAWFSGYRYRYIYSQKSIDKLKQLSIASSKYRPKIIHDIEHSLIRRGD